MTNLKQHFIAIRVIQRASVWSKRLWGDVYLVKARDFDTVIAEEIKAEMITGLEIDGCSITQILEMKNYYLEKKGRLP